MCLVVNGLIMECILVCLNHFSGPLLSRWQPKSMGVLCPVSPDSRNQMNFNKYYTLRRACHQLLNIQLFVNPHTKSDMIPISRLIPSQKLTNLPSLTTPAPNATVRYYLDIDYIVITAAQYV